jgi:hypothetical protein
MLLDVVDGVLHRADLLGVFIGDVDGERLLEGEHQLDQAEGVGPEVVDEGHLGTDLRLVDIELIFDDALNFRGDISTFSHACLPSKTRENRAGPLTDFAARRTEKSQRKNFFAPARSAYHR